ncbi:MAG: hypothetical protein JWN03_4532 [Nocardia sp.]|uniref:DUF7161 family protein n=1 Tax=Nocardia sp. TaxID=1821 RepID=UPI00262CDDDB|nr:hypothetical protein [Nocardia sp.]MCU1644257.1 hypothetical protein [Nocardia sp.]
MIDPRPALIEFGEELMTRPPRPWERGTEPWDRFAAIWQVQPGRMSSNGVEFHGTRWQGAAIPAVRDAEDLLEGFRREIGWGAVVLTLDQVAGAARVHLFGGDTDPIWEKTVATEPDVAERAFELFGTGMALPDRASANWIPLRADQSELAGLTGKLLVPDPADDDGRPAQLPPGTQYVAIIDDEPTVNLTVRVWAPGVVSSPFVRYDQLACRTPQTIESLLGT